MTEQERSFEAWFRTAEDCPNGHKETAKEAFLAGWKRERAKAKPKTIEAKAFYPSFVILTGSMEGWDKWVERWIVENAIPNGTRIRMTVEEV